MKPSVYIETSIPSFYYEAREIPEFIAMRNWTRQWWSERMIYHDCHTSAATVDELSEGDHPHKDDKIRLLDEIPYLEVNDEIVDIVEVYIANHVMPHDVLGDALHLAVASFHKMDYLMTWNCSHLANANKKKHIRRINERLRISTPDIVTPWELLED